MLRLNLIYDGGRISWDDSFDKKIQYFEDLYFIKPIQGGYVVEVYSLQEEILISYTRNLQPILMFDKLDPQSGEITDGGAKLLSQGPLKIEVPYYPNINHVLVRDNDMEIIFFADLSAFARPEEKTIEQPVDLTEESPQPAKKYFPIYWLLFGLLGIVIFIYFIFKIKSSGHKQD